MLMVLCDKKYSFLLKRLKSVSLNTLKRIMLFEGMSGRSQWIFLEVCLSKSIQGRCHKPCHFVILANLFPVNHDLKLVIKTN